MQECLNVRDLLDKTLRFDYGFDGSREFFEECIARLEFITSELNAASETDLNAVETNGGHLNELAGLICRIERSSLGEYSWPFVEELKKIAVATCTEATLHGDKPPKVYVLADGGLDRYAIYSEKKKPSGSKRLILTIVFPKSLKHFVLFHSILGHELGHAIWHRSKHQQYIKSRVIAVLADPAGIFASPQATARHLYSQSAPQEAKDFLSRVGFGEAELFSNVQWTAWLEEILCDLIGLVTFGPSFVAALCELLYGLTPSGVTFGRSHPLTSWRVNLILKGATLLGYDAVPESSHPLHNDLQAFWSYARGFQKSGTWFDVFSESQIGSVLAAIQELLGRLPPASYGAPTFDALYELLAQLKKQIPPVGFKINERGESVCNSVDFRHITFAGWIASKCNPTAEVPFSLINKLCEHAIMQQRAIDTMLRAA